MNSKPSANKKNYLRALAIFLPIALVAIVAFNSQNIEDYLSAASYQPTPASSSVEASLGLTVAGSRIFRASHPDITTDFDEFSNICYEGQNATEVSIKGCYVSNNIHVYNVTDSELSGIVESTSAHELLHAAWARLSDSEKSHLTPILQEVYDNSSSEFKNTLVSYPEEDQIEEIYVRSATQLSDLPDTLESHFARYFTDRQALVRYYESYSATFLKLEKELNDISASIDSLKSKIDSLTTEIDVEMATLSVDIDGFNNCANISGCFSDGEFWARRSDLSYRQSTLEEKIQILNSIITEHNQLVNRYNDNILHSRSLESVINPNLQPLEIK